MIAGWIAVTEPGCEAGSHADEVMGAYLVWEMGGRWEQPTVMDCGCTLEFVRATERGWSYATQEPKG